MTDNNSLMLRGHRRPRRAPIRVCHLGKYYPPAPGGIETHVRTLARAQAQLGLDVTVACVNHLNRAGHDTSFARYGQTLTEIENDHGVRVVRVGRSATVARFDICPRLPRVIRQLQTNRAIDVLHLHTPNPTMLLAVAALTGSAMPLVVTHHSDVVKQRVLRRVLEPFEKRVYTRAASVLASTASYASASALLARHAEKLQVMPLGLDLAPFITPSMETMSQEQRIRAKFASDERGDATPLWLSVGRCVYYKGYETGIAALRHVPGKLLIVGRGPLEVELRNLARRLGVADRIVWWGHATPDELAGLYRAATALWFPSNARSEAFGLVQIEAMASGCPVINTHIPNSGVAWVSRHEETGLTVPMDDPHAFALAANRLWNDRALRARLSTAGKTRAEAEFGHETMAERSIEVYEGVLARHEEIVPAAASIRLADWVRQTRDDSSSSSSNVSAFRHGTRSHGAFLA